MLTSCSACVGNDDDLRSVALGRPRRVRRHEAGRGLRRPHHRVGRRLRASCAAAATAAACRFVDAPVSGGQAGAIERRAHRHVRRRASRVRRHAKPVAMAFSTRRHAAGRAAAPASWPRWSTRSCIAGLGAGPVGGASPSAKKAGLDMEAVLEVIGKGAAQSWQMDNRGTTDDRRQVRLRLRGRLDAQGPRPRARRRRGATARACR